MMVEKVSSKNWLRYMIVTTLTTPSSLEPLVSTACLCQGGTHWRSLHVGILLRTTQLVSYWMVALFVRSKQSKFLYYKRVLLTSVLKVLFKDS